MDVPLPTTGHFCCFALSTHTGDDLIAPIKFGNGLYAVSKPPFYIDDWWRQQLGALEVHQVEQCNLFLLAFADDPSITARDLNNKVNIHYLSLLLEGVAYSRNGIILGGDNAVNGLRVSSIGWLTDYPVPLLFSSPEVTRKHLEYTSQLAAGVEVIYSSSSDHYLRLRKGFNSLINGIKHHEVHNRLHQCVRAIEGVIKPKQGEGTSNFKYRCQFFAGRKPQDTQVLEELYELRSAAEHLNPMINKLTGYPPYQRDEIKALRAVQAELLASFVYRKILATPIILKSFADDAAIDKVWAQDSRSLIAYWGKTIALHISPKLIAPRLPEWE